MRAHLSARLSAGRRDRGITAVQFDPDKADLGRS
jgi:hypothetical protein